MLCSNDRSNTNGGQVNNGGTTAHSSRRRRRGGPAAASSSSTARQTATHLQHNPGGRTTNGGGTGGRGGGGGGRGGGHRKIWEENTPAAATTSSAATTGAGRSQNGGQRKGSAAAAGGGVSRPAVAPAAGNGFGGGGGAGGGGRGVHPGMLESEFLAATGQTNPGTEGGTVLSSLSLEEVPYDRDLRYGSALWETGRRWFQGGGVKLLCSSRGSVSSRWRPACPACSLAISTPVSGKVCPAARGPKTDVCFGLSREERKPLRFVFVECFMECFVKLATLFSGSSIHAAVSPSARKQKVA